MSITRGGNAPQLLRVSSCCSRGDPAVPVEAGTVPESRAIRMLPTHVGLCVQSCSAAVPTRAEAGACLALLCPGLPSLSGIQRWLRAAHTLQLALRTGVTRPLGLLGAQRKGCCKGHPYLWGGALNATACPAGQDARTL